MASESLQYGWGDLVRPGIEPSVPLRQQDRGRVNPEFTGPRGENRGGRLWRRPFVRVATRVAVIGGTTAGLLAPKTQDLITVVSSVAKIFH